MIQLEGEVFEAVQGGELFADCKTFVDSRPRHDPDEVLADFRARRDRPGFSLARFVDEHFELPAEGTAAADRAPCNDPMEARCTALWAALRREADDPDVRWSTLLPLPRPYVVPGGRFREVYYWDTYFTLEGLCTCSGDEHPPLVESVVTNFTDLVRRHGHVPNGNRRYYLGRSQPPFLSFMVDLLERQAGRAAVRPHVEALRAELGFWSDGAAELERERDARRRVVRLRDGHVLNRYFDDERGPRPEAWRADAAVARASGREQIDVDLRAACESGWDFSSRWFGDPRSIRTIRTTEVVPVDLNALLFHLEARLGAWLEEADPAEAARCRARAAARREAIDALLWDEERGLYLDLDLVTGERLDRPSLATVAPLFVGAASARQAAAVARTLETRFLRPGGLVTTLVETGQQWDAPNGWAPLQFMAVRGLERYGHDGLAAEIARRWLALNRAVFARTGCMMEKYDVCDLDREAGGGEYPCQDGFGWTNGVALALLAQGHRG